MIGLFAATGMEVTGLRRRLNVRESSREEGCRIEQGRYGDSDVLLVQFGMGKARAKAAGKSILPRYPLSAVLSLGFAGALVGALSAGDVVLCSAVRHGREDAIECDSNLLFRAATAAQPFAVTNAVAVSSDTFVSGPVAKRGLGVSSGASVVDMESYWIGKRAQELGLPFLSVRAISDPLTARLPPIERFIDGDGCWCPGRIALHCLTKPQSLVRLLSFGRAARCAASNLALAMDGILARLCEGATITE
jgi:adenosylhomocysteine nucleosidase